MQRLSEDEHAGRFIDKDTIPKCRDWNIHCLFKEIASDMQAVVNELKIDERPGLLRRGKGIMFLSGDVHQELEESMNELAVSTEGLYLSSFVNQHMLRQTWETSKRLLYFWTIF